MGLDMYLYDKIYVNDNTVTVKSTEYTSVDFITRRIGYWRKANAIHNWFDRNIENGVENCMEYYISREMLERLLKTCKEVLKHKEKAKELLPTVEGFFYGSTKYDEDYFIDIKNTIKILEKALNDAEGDIYYEASW